MTRPLRLGAPVDMHTSACTSFMPILHANQTLHKHAKGFCIQVFNMHTCLPQQAQTSWVPFTQSEASHHPAYIELLSLPYFQFQDCNRKTYLYFEKSRPTFSGDLVWLRCWCSAFNTWPKPAFGAEVSLLIARSGRQWGRRGVTPIALHFRGSWSSLILSNGHYSASSYRSKIPAPKIEKYKNSIDWAMHKWNYF